jgi:hypothetical protein
MKSDRNLQYLLPGDPASRQRLANNQELLRETLEEVVVLSLLMNILKTMR